MTTRTVPARSAFAITPDNSNTFASTTRAVYVGTAGNLVVTMEGSGAEIALVAVPAGSFLPIGVIKVHESTTAEDIVGFY